ncbi:MAG: hydroxyethylthiazole kinase [Hyphomicrobiales bacterium]|nr:hydroxyethylthiazole kinase [Hyphomicrobiales bacterium]
MPDIPAAAAMALACLRARGPRVQCLTNTVAQAITANLLHAAGVRASMSTHPAEVAAMSASADALLVNLGTPDAAREAAVPVAIAATSKAGRPIVLDPVFVDASPVRMSLAARVLETPGVVVKGNEREMAALARTHGPALQRAAVLVTTGPVDVVRAGSRTARIANGHPYMAAVTGLGCAAGALVAAFLAVERDAFLATSAALLTLGIAGEVAAEHSQGPGSFAVALLDAMHHLDAVTLQSRARLS